MTEPNRLGSFADARLGDDLLWRDVRVKRFPDPVPALFLDRDGVVIEEKEYIHDPDQVELLSGIPELIRAARSLGMAVVEITNQAGIGRGYFGWREFVQVEDRVSQVLAGQGVSRDAVLACPFHPEGRPPYRIADHSWRKPNPGMLLEAARLLNLNLNLSMLVGDKVLDLQAARSAGLGCGVHVLTGHGLAHREASMQVATPNFSVHIVKSAGEAIPLLQLGQANTEQFTECPPRN
jgi:D-glycero-D-manno-heptose 1,7-bisphosphate phosphatase